MRMERQNQGLDADAWQRRSGQTFAVKGEEWAKSLKHFTLQTGKTGANGWRRILIQKKRFGWERLAQMAGEEF
jgi:hypothetical protein